MRAVALGNFDGIHTAHRKVLENAAQCEQSLCLLFREHPLAWTRGKAPERLLSPDKTEQKILECGIKRCEYLDFGAVKDLSPQQFFEDILLKKYKADCICCGYNYTFGKNKTGNIAVLEALCRQNGITLVVAPKIEYEGEAVSSSRIRACIRKGEIEKANAMLGYEFTYEGEILRGKELGRQLGFPTINQRFSGESVKPLSGVYASVVTIGAKQYRGLTNIGDNPTIGTDGFRSETYLFDFCEEVYGKQASVALLKRIREEKKFESLEELKTQVLKDIERVKEDV